MGESQGDRLVRRLRPRRLVSVLKAMPSVPLIVKFPKISVESTLGMNSFRCKPLLDLKMVAEGKIGSRRVLSFKHSELTYHTITSVKILRIWLQNRYILTLKKMGIRDLFFSTADLTDFTQVRGLMVNGAIHKALIEVDEEGAEAAAATVLSMTSRSRPMPPKTTFTCNRPFVFYIKDNEANNILFMGVYRGLEGPLLDLVIIMIYRCKPD
nr:serpin B3-like [Penaeus vannamei]